MVAGGGRVIGRAPWVGRHGTEAAGRAVGDAAPSDQQHDQRRRSEQQLSDGSRAPGLDGAVPSAVVAAPGGGHRGSRTPPYSGSASKLTR